MKKLVHHATEVTNCLKKHNALMVKNLTVMRKKLEICAHILYSLNQTVTNRKIFYGQATLNGLKDHEDRQLKPERIELNMLASLMADYRDVMKKFNLPLVFLQKCISIILNQNQLASIVGNYDLEEDRMHLFSILYIYVHKCSSSFNLDYFSKINFKKGVFRLQILNVNFKYQDFLLNIVLDQKESELLKNLKILGLFYLEKYLKHKDLNVFMKFISMLDLIFQLCLYKQMYSGKNICILFKNCYEGSEKLEVLSVDSDFAAMNKHNIQLNIRKISGHRSVVFEWWNFYSKWPMKTDGNHYFQGLHYK